MPWKSRELFPTTWITLRVTHNGAGESRLLGKEVSPAPLTSLEQLSLEFDGKARSRLTWQITDRRFPMRPE
jgi:hypothetical protein